MAKSGWKWHFFISKSLEKLRSRDPRLVELKNVGDAFERDSFGISNFLGGFDCTKWASSQTDSET